MYRDDALTYAGVAAGVSASTYVAYRVVDQGTYGRPWTAFDYGKMLAIGVVAAVPGALVGGVAGYMTNSMVDKVAEIRYRRANRTP